MISFGVGAFPRASPAACHAPNGGPDSLNFNEALRSRPDAPEEVRDLLVMISVKVWSGGVFNIGEYGGLEESFPGLVVMASGSTVRSEVRFSLVLVMCNA